MSSLFRGDHFSTDSSWVRSGSLFAGAIAQEFVGFRGTGENQRTTPRNEDAVNTSRAIGRSDL